MLASSTRLQNSANQGVNCKTTTNNRGMVLQSFTPDQQKVTKDFYVKLFTEVLFASVKPKITNSQVDKIIEKLPEIIFEWQYMETFLKEKGFVFHEKLVCSYSGSNSLKEFFQNVNGMTHKFAQEQGFKFQGASTSTTQVLQNSTGSNQSNNRKNSTQQERESQLGTNLRRRKLLQQNNLASPAPLAPSPIAVLDQQLTTQSAAQHQRNHSKFDTMNFHDVVQEENKSQEPSQQKVENSSDIERQDKKRRTRELMARKQIKVQTMSSNRTIEKVEFNLNSNSCLNSIFSSKIQDLPVETLRNQNLLQDYDDQREDFQISLRQNCSFLTQNLHLGQCLDQNDQNDLRQEMNDRKSLDQVQIDYEQMQTKMQFYDFKQIQFEKDCDDETNDLRIPLNQTESSSRKRVNFPIEESNSHNKVVCIVPQKL